MVNRPFSWRHGSPCDHHLARQDNLDSRGRHRAHLGHIQRLLQAVVANQFARFPEFPDPDLLIKLERRALDLGIGPENLAQKRFAEPVRRFVRPRSIGPPYDMTIANHVDRQDSGLDIR